MQDSSDEQGTKLVAAWTSFVSEPAPSASVRRGDAAAAALHAVVVSAVCAKLRRGRGDPDVQDIAQRVTANVWRHAVGSPEDMESLPRYARRSAAHAVVDFFRRKGSEQRSVPFDDSVLDGASDLAWRERDRVDASDSPATDSQELLARAVAQLPESYRELLRSHYQDGHSLDDLVRERHASAADSVSHEIGPTGQCVQCRNNVYKLHERAKLRLASLYTKLAAEGAS